MFDGSPHGGSALRVVPPATLERHLKADAAKKASAAVDAEKQDLSPLAHHIKTLFDQFKRHRDSYNGWSGRLMSALRAFNGEYDPAKLALIKQFAGSEVYARVIAMKCRAASSLLRDVYLGPDRSWGIDPPADPDVPAAITDSVARLVQAEAGTLAQGGQPINPAMLRDRVNQLMEAARGAEKKQAKKRAKLSEAKLEETLNDGNFYKALAEFLVDLPLFPFACLKGPTVRIVPTVSWEGGVANIAQKPRMFWGRISPFDIWFTPGASDIENADVIERTRLSRSDLNDLLDLPGYNHEAIRTILEDHGRGGLVDHWDSNDSERAEYENRENPQHNQSGMITCLEYYGNVQGRMLKEFNFTNEQVPDELRDYAVQAWMIGSHIIKVQLSPSPRKRHNYFITSFEKVPGTPVGNGLPDILADIQEVCNATLRAMVNNLSISSGPQVVINQDRLAPGEDGESLYPWKRWHVNSDPLGNNTQPPISFFQPNSNAQELLGVYKEVNTIADEISAIPKYMSGGGPGGGAGRTASGLAMLMGNASKILQMVAANIDRDVFDPLLTQLFDMLMLTDDSGVLRGDENIVVKGVNVVVQRETERARQLEFLQTTANPIDFQIMGPQGRAAVLRSVSKTIGLGGETIIPGDDELAAMALAQQAQPPGEAAAQAEGSKQSSTVTNDMGPRTRLTGGAG